MSSWARFIANTCSFFSHFFYQHFPKSEHQNEWVFGVKNRGTVVNLWLAKSPQQKQERGRGMQALSFSLSLSTHACEHTLGCHRERNHSFPPCDFSTQQQPGLLWNLPAPMLVGVGVSSTPNPVNPCEHMHATSCIACHTSFCHI